MKIRLIEKLKKWFSIGKSRKSGSKSPIYNTEQQSPSIYKEEHLQKIVSYPVYFAGMFQGRRDVSVPSFDLDIDDIIP